MTVHYSVESLPSLFLSDKYLSDKERYTTTHKVNIDSLCSFLNSIQINKQYFRTGIQVKNPKYKRKIYDDTSVIKQLKLSLNKMSGVTFESLSQDICKQIESKGHLYPLLLQYIFEQSLLHHNYGTYYARLVELLHKKYNNHSLINSQCETIYQQINKIDTSEMSDYSVLCSKNKHTDQLIGYSMFITELEIKGVIHNKIDRVIESLFTKLSSTSEDECYKCVICLYNIFKILYKDSPINENYKTHLSESASTMKFMKVKFKLMDILERR